MFGSLHQKYIQNTPQYLRSGGFANEAAFVQANIEQLKSAVVSPDSDYANLVIPKQYIPTFLRSVIGGSSIGKWEHIQPDNIPGVIDTFVRWVAANIVHVNYRYADVATQDWYNLALAAWPTNRQTALWHLGRACHLVEDICVPHHTSLRGAFAEIYNIIIDKSTSQDAYELYCEKMYTPPSMKYNLSVLFNIHNEVLSTAAQARTYMDLCDGITLPSWMAQSRFKDMYYALNRSWREDFYTCANFSNNKAQENTVRLIHTFLRAVNFV